MLSREINSFLFFDKLKKLSILSKNLYFTSWYSMTKKEFMLQVIAFLPDWKMGWGLKPLIENNQLEPDVFEKLYQIFRENVHSTYSQYEKLQFKERLLNSEALKLQERAQSESDQVDLEAMFETL